MGRGEYGRRLNLVSSLLWMLSGGVMAGMVVLGITHGQLGDRLLAAFNTILNPPQPAPKVDVRSLVLKQVRESSELTTASFTMEAVVPTEQDATFGGIPIGKTKLLYIAYGEVQAGVDLSQLTIANVQSTGDSIRIQLPPAKILNQKIDVNRSQVYDYNRGALGLGPDVGPNLQSLAQQEALKKIVAAACAEGLLNRAGDRAKLVVTQLLNTAGYKTVTVDASPIRADACTTSPAASPIPASPSPIPSVSPVPSLTPLPLPWDSQPMPVSPSP